MTLPSLSQIQKLKRDNPELYQYLLELRTAMANAQSSSTTSPAAPAATSNAALDAHIANTETHGAVGKVVGTQNTQTLTNKTLTSPVISTPTGIIGSDIVMSRVAGSTYSTAQHWRNNLSSAGCVNGGVITDAGSGNINVSGGQGTLRDADSNTATLYFIDWSALNGTNVPADTVRYVGVEWNAGVPQVTVRTTDNWNYHTDFPLGVVVNEGGTLLHIVAGDKHTISDMPTHTMERFEHASPYARDIVTGGLLLGETGTRNITITGGDIWQKLTVFTFTAFNTAVSGSFSAYYRNGVGGFTKVATLTQWPNTQYDDGTGTLATLGTNKYGTLWFYIEPDDSDVVMIYGRGEYSNQAAAETEPPPPSVPNRMVEGGMLVGRMIFQKSATTASSISSAFNVTFTPSAISNHAALSNLDFSVAEHTGQLPIANGGTGADTAAAALTALGAEASANKDATGGYAGLTLFKINFKNALGTIVSWLTNSNTAARTYTLQDRDGTIADDTDLALKAPLLAPGFTGPNTITGTSATDLPTYSAEFLTGSGWTSTGWTGSWAAGWTHTAGNTNVLSYPAAAVNATPYQIAYTITGRTAGNVVISFGAQSITVSATGAFGPTTTSTANLTITPSSDFNGTIVISIKSITGVSTALETFKSSDGTARVEVRANKNDYNMFIGNNSGGNNTSGTFNTAIGYNCLYKNTTGIYNTGIGAVALYVNTVGNYCTAIGVSALQNNIIGSFLTAIGVNALFNNTTGSKNTGEGVNALYDVTTGSNNTAVGYNTGRGVNTGSGNTIIGANVTGLPGGLSNNVIIADGDGNQRLNIDSSGNGTVGGTFSASNLSGTNTGDNAANGTTVNLTGNQSVAGVKTFTDGSVIKGVTDASSAAAGYVGEFISAGPTTAGNGNANATIVTSGGGITSATVGSAAGTGYFVGQLLQVNGGGGTTGFIQVATITGGGLTGPVGTYTVAIAGTGYSNTSNVPTVAGYVSTAVNCTLQGIALTAGDWDISCSAHANPATAVAITSLTAGIGTTAASFSGASSGSDFMKCAINTSAGFGSISIPRKRVTINATTNYYLNASAAGAAGGSVILGYISARRIR